MQCHFHCRQQEQETESEKTFPVDTKPSVGAIHVPNNSVQEKKKKTLTHYHMLAYQPTDDDTFS